ncbi:MAG: indolepyruvate ferredoxin oxidoreductase family protein [Alphaproteobacteria bacterium]|jgi:indolepyruvate ferredoxin oxidoreductase|nr:indolepyruvate ferredoxin oxidoreductase family protein [Alphaproteobacteria bacterium]
MALAAVTLDDKYTLETGRIYLTGAQALVRLPLMQRKRDEAAGLNTAGFISGYRGSPLGGFDQQLWKARRYLAESHIHFQPGVNEDLGATAVWGSQQVNLWPGGRYDGVFGLWYGKGPGVDRSGDVLKHANFAGTAPHGGVLALAGDDHACKSSTVPHQSEHAFVSAMIPVLNPSNVQEFLDLGLYGWAMSRFAGTWVAFKTIADTVDSSASVSVDPHRVDIALPDIELPPGGLGIRWPDPPMVQEERLMRHKLYAALAFVRENRLDRVVWGAQDRRIGLVTTGKSHLDTRQALEDLGIPEERARELGIAIYKVTMPWPLEPQGVRAFAEGLDELIVVEEKRALIENQLKEQLYNWQADRRPVIVGKFDEERNWILPSTGELTPSQIAVVIGKRLLKRIDDEGIAARVRFLEEKEASKVVRHPKAVDRPPWYCSGCPHNTSTVVPEGSRALGGIGCHYMATWMNRSTETFSQMGGEGVAAIGQQPFREAEHVFTNLGDGTYFHSGILAVRAAIAAGINITYKILYNDAVAMTGGQPVDGTMTVPMIAHQLKAEGVEKVVVVSDEPEKYDNLSGLPHGTPVQHRDDLDPIQKELRETPGVTVMIYDQTCAAEKRRRRKRGLMEDLNRRVVINELVCEGCGDCSKQSNCLSVVPIDTEWGRKRAIDQSSCNKDFSCVKGFCPSFVDVIGGTPKKPKAAAGAAGDGFPALPEPEIPALDRPFNLLITGIGGTGVVTIGALLGMAAHLEGKGCSVLDQAGLAQKGGAVMSHVRLARAPEDLNAVRIPAGGAHLVLGCDLVVAAGAEARSTVKPGTTRIVANGHETITGAFTQDPGWRFPGGEMVDILRETAGDAARVDALDATRLATRLLGDSIATNLFMLGFAWQKGLIPVSGAALDQAIELNGVAVGMNRAALLWGRRAAHDLAAVEAVVAEARGPDRDARRLSGSVEETIDRRQAFLTDYHDAAYAARYRDRVDRVRAAEEAAAGAPPTDAEGRTPPGALPLTEAVAQTLYRLMAIKDEYEVARLYTDGRFLKQLRDQFDGDVKLRLHLAPPLLAERDPETGHLKKRTYGPWMLKAFGVLARFKRLRGTRWDIFGYTEERRMERRLIGAYEAVVDEVIGGLTADNRDLAVEIAKVAGEIKGFGHVKEANLKVAKAREAELLAAWRNPEAPARVAAE